MTTFQSAVEQILKLKRSNVARRKVSAVMLMAAMLMPVTAPIPAWAYEYRLPQPIDDGLRLTAEQPGLIESSKVLLSGLMDNFAAFLIPAGKRNASEETSFNVVAAESKVRNIETKTEGVKEAAVGQILPLFAIPVDKNDNPVNGVAPRWETSDDKVVKVIDSSTAVAMTPGTATLTVSSGSVKREVVISVKTSLPATMPPPDDEGETRSSFSPENNLGTPMGQVDAQAPNSPAALGGRRFTERVGSANFNFNIPLASLPGRGIDAGVSLTYNSRIWNFWQNPIAPHLSRYRYNIDGDWLAPGFKLTLGSVKRVNYYAYSLTSPDGTRHELAYISGDNYARTYESTDGSFVRLYITSTGSDVNSIATVRYPDGSSAVYTSLDSGVSHNRFFPTKITDRNGNFIQIAYKPSDTSGRIWYIRDTLNRYTNFHYDGDNKLVAITVPGFDGGSARQTARFYYETMTFDTTTPRFQNIGHTMPASAVVLRYIYFPGTNNGIKYDYSPAWGMIYKISDLRGTQVSNPTDLNNTGTVTTEGQAAATTEYNYPLTLGSPLTDVPKYTLRTDDWIGRTTPQAPQTIYESERDTTNNRVKSKIKSPDGTITETWAKIAPAAWDDGLVTDTFTKTVISLQLGTYKTWSHTKIFWENQAGTSGRQNPRVTKIEQTNDAEQTRATTFVYDGYNNQTLIKEHDFATPGTLGTELRKTETTYETGAAWVNNRLISLPKLVKTTVNGVVVSKTAVEYDNNGGSAASYLTSRTDIDPQTHDVGFNWSSTGYNSATDFRGNITKVTAFSDATLETDANASVTTSKYDVAGNLIETGASCCKEKAWEYIKANEYAYPISEEQGDAGQLETSVTYDRNTGLVKTQTDENNQTTTFTYDPANLRQTRIDYVDAAWTTFEVNNSSYPYHIKTTSRLDTNRNVSSWRFEDGRGSNFRSRTQTANGYLSGDTDFDNMGRPVKSFNQYTVASLDDPRPGNAKFTELTQIDALGRPLVTTLPDNTTTQAEYSGLIATVTDQAGKKRRQMADALGRLIRVDEPINSPPDGNALGPVNTPHQPTFYEYDGNDNLSKVTQTAGITTQERLFKYDSLSRLTHERQVEATATLNSSGVKIGVGGQWTGFYKYNTDNLLTEGVDARGVKTKFTYDGLNRVATVVYENETGYTTPNVTYTYDEAESNFYNNGRLTKIRTAPNAGQGTPETVQNYDYNTVGQVAKHVQSIGNQTYQLQYGYNHAGQLVSETYPSGKVVTVTVDDFGRLATVADPQRTYVGGMSFNDRGLLSQINLGNGTHETFGYNDRFQMDSQSLKKGTEVLQKYDYSYGTVDLANGTVDATKNNGQLGKVEGWIGANKQWSQRFGYDELGRLKEAREHKQGDNAQLTYKQVFDFDRFGNLYRKAANNPTAGQQHPLPYTPIEEATTPGTGDIEKETNRFRTGTTYDEAGQVVTDNKFRSMSFSYDANGRQVKGSRAGVPDAWTVYDALGNRVAAKVNDVWQYMVYDAFGKLVAEYGLAAEGLGGVKYVQQDWQGSVRTITNNNGFAMARMDHQAFGGDIPLGTGLRSIEHGYSSDPATRQGYGLTEDDAATGQQHTWWRKLETVAGRWTRPDPYNGSMETGNPQSFNRFAYVIGDPVSFVDPSGLLDCLPGFYSRAWGYGSMTIDGETYSYLYEECVPFRSTGSGGGGGAPGYDRGGGGVVTPRDRRDADAALSSCIINAVGKFTRDQNVAKVNFYSRVGPAAGAAIISALAALVAPGPVKIPLGVLAAHFGAQAWGAVMDYAYKHAANDEALLQEASKCFGAAKKASKSALARARNDINQQLGSTSWRTVRDIILGRMRTPLIPPVR